jgi:hypothetical protein
MQLSSLRSALDDWLQDSGVQWDSVRLNRCLNLGLREVEKHILSVDPEAFKCTLTAATTVPATGTDNIYAYPAGTFAVHEVALSSDGVTYTPLTRLALQHIREDAQTGTGLAGFVPYDASHFMLWPVPTSAVTSGLRIIIAPTLVMTDDTDEDPLPLQFENMLLLESQKIALRDTGEPTDKIQAEINQLKTETPRFYLTHTTPSFIVPMMPRY